MKPQKFQKKNLKENNEKMSKEIAELERKNRYSVKDALLRRKRLMVDNFPEGKDPLEIIKDIANEAGIEEFQESHITHKTKWLSKPQGKPEKWVMRVTFKFEEMKEKFHHRDNKEKLKSLPDDHYLKIVNVYPDLPQDERNDHNKAKIESAQ